MNPRFDSPSLVSLERGRTDEILGLNWFSSFHFSNGHAAGAQKSCFPRAPSPSRIRGHPPHRDAPSPLITTILARDTQSTKLVCILYERIPSLVFVLVHDVSRVARPPRPPRLLVDAVRLGVRSPPARNRTRARASDAGPSSSRISSMRNPPCLAPVSSLALAGPASAPSRRRSGDGGTLTLGSVVAVAYVSRVVTGTGPGPAPAPARAHAPFPPREHWTVALDPAGGDSGRVLGVPTRRRTWALRLGPSTRTPRRDRRDAGDEVLIRERRRGRW